MTRDEGRGRQDIVMVGEARHGNKASRRIHMPAFVLASLSIFPF